MTYLNKHWALRVLRLQLTVANEEDDSVIHNADDDDRYSELLQPLSWIWVGGTETDADIENVKQFCLGTLLLVFCKGGSGFSPGIGATGLLVLVAAKAPSPNNIMSEKGSDDEIKYDDAVVVAVRLSAFKSEIGVGKRG